MFRTARSLARAPSLPAVFCALLLGGCASTTILSSANPAGSRPPDWPDFRMLPVQLHGSVPGTSNATLASMFPSMPPTQYAGVGALPVPSVKRHIVLYVNPAAPLPTEALCSTPTAFQPGGQDGQSATVTGALCDGNQVITWARGRVLTAGATPDQLRHNLNTVRIQLFDSLTPGANHPSRLFAGKLYG